MRILIADALEPTAIEALVARGHQCDVDAGLTAEALPGRVAGYEALVVRSTRVTADTVRAADALRLVVRAGAGTNTIDRAAATAAGVAVTNVPGRNAIAVAELALGLMLAVDRRIPDSVIALRAGRWDKKGLSRGAVGLHGRALGILGLGNIGLAVAERAAAFGMSLWSLERPGRGADTQRRIADLGVGLLGSQPELAAAVDVLSLHIPGGDSTAGVVDEQTIRAMRPGAILVNTSRADVVDTSALLQALDDGRIRAGLDVFPDEPTTGTADWASRLATHPAVVGTHHVGASTEQAQRAVAEGVVEVVDGFVQGKPVHVVNPEALVAGAEG